MDQEEKKYPSTGEEGGDQTPNNDDVNFSEEDIGDLDEDLQKKVKTLEVQRMRHKEKAQKAEEERQKLEEENKRLQEQLEGKKKPEPKPEPKKEKNNDDDLWREKIDIRTSQVGRDLTDEELDYAVKIAKAEGSSIKEVVSSGDFKDYVEFKREKIKKEESTPSPNKRNGEGGHNFERIVENPKLLHDLSHEEQKKFREWHESR
jgi:hypothetical protein